MMVIYIYIYVKIGEMYILQSILYFAFLFKRKKIYIYTDSLSISKYVLVDSQFPVPSRSLVLFKDPPKKGTHETSGGPESGKCPATSLTLHQASHLKNIRGIVEQNYQRENQEKKKW